MARVCEFCGKGTTTGRTIKRKGLPKCKGGIGLKTVGISKRKFKPKEVLRHINADRRDLNNCISLLNNVIISDDSTG